MQYYQYALDLVTDVFDLDCDDEMRETIEKSARHLYGLVHARYVVTTRGLAKMVCYLPVALAASAVLLGRFTHFVKAIPKHLLTPRLFSSSSFSTAQLEKYKKSDFGKCPRVNCHSHPLLPMGLSDIPNVRPVKLYCARCEDIYNPKSTRHAVIDGAYFGTSFHNILFQVYPALIPPKTADRYIPRVYGFKVHASAALIRWQNTKRDDMKRRLRRLEIESGFKDGDDEDLEDGDVDDDEDQLRINQDHVSNGGIVAV